jgi:protein-S-isoprenylcysteine O-methyltransferase Ste14
LDADNAERAIDGVRRPAMSTPVQNAQGGARVRIPPPLPFVAALVVGALLNSRVLTLAFPVPRWLTLGAAVLALAAAVALFAGSFHWFRATGQRPQPWLPSPSLIIEGPYRFTRNPMYVAMTLTQIALGLLLDDAWIVALAPLSLTVVHQTAVRPEEANLTEKFGEPYRRYMASVRRYL